MANVYGSLVTPRAKRIATFGLVLMIGVLLMAGYGAFSLMPALRAEKSAYHLHETKRAGKVLAAQILFATGYWSVCSILTLSMVGVAWMYRREVNRMFAVESQKLWKEHNEEPEPLS